MNYRNEIAVGILSLENVFIKYLMLDIPTVPQTGSPSNKHTFNALFFTKQGNPDTPMSEQDYLLNSVFNDSFINSALDELNDKELLYYIIHLDCNFPTGSKLSALFSNLANKNHSGKEQPPAIRKLLHGIDFAKLCSHIANMIQYAQKTNIEIDKNLRQYISAVLQNDTILAEYTVKANCNTSSEYLSWFLLYALFDTANFKIYFEKYMTTPATLPNMILDDYSGFDSNTFKVYKRIYFYYNLTTIALVALYGIQICCLAIPFAGNFSLKSNNAHFLTFSIIMLSVSIFLIMLRYIPFYFARLTTSLRMELLDMHPNEYSISKEDKQYVFNDISKSFTSIWNIRRVMIGILIACSAFSFFMSFKENSFPLFFVYMLIIVILFILVDHIAHSNVTYKKYNNAFGYQGYSSITSVFWGRTKMLSWDYNRKTNRFEHTQDYKFDQHSDECLRYIMYQVVDEEKLIWTITGIVLHIMNIVSLLIGIIQFILPIRSYFRIPIDTYYSVFCIIFILINGILNIFMLLNSQKHYTKIGYFRYYSSRSSANKVFIQQVFKDNYINGTITETHILRGIYNYCQNKFENGTPIEDIYPLADRVTIQNILYTSHRRNFIILIIINIIVIFTAWHTNSMSVFITTPVSIAIYLLITFVILPTTYKRHIIKYLPTSEGKD